MEIVACEQPAELDLAELLRCIFCGVEGGGLSWVERSNFRTSKSSECLVPPERSPLFPHACNQHVAVVAPTDPPELLRENPANLLSTDCCLDIRKPLFDTSNCKVTWQNVPKRDGDKPIPVREL